MTAPTENITIIRSTFKARYKYWNNYKRGSFLINVLAKEYKIEENNLMRGLLKKY